ncbi:hypothetical protein BASA60_003300 [Batrachochytrium salamandrivorans]|nr:hypothetical protein BASA62_008667 [Batrachochytrium salamandrivorans]KAH6579450.1 hypothetical protein BASA60_003300 [Batrachochytrium salamandrivorans]KAH9245336.1 hypothetical protein BASA81_017182 [Batrachochytrium salamandrivorans]
MQLFYLLSFVAAVSHAAALPQPAGLSDKYSSNVDITFASFLGARSYQPVLNSKEDSATLVSLKRRADSDGASGKPRRSSPPPSPLLTPEDVEKIIAKFFKDSDFTSANISSTIDKVGDGAVDFYKDGERAGKEIGGTAGPMLKRYLDRDIYVIVALIGWMVKEGSPIMGVIRSVVGDEEYFKFFREFITALEESAYVSSEKEGEVVKAVSNILTKTGTVIENVNTINTSFKDLFDSRMKLFTLLGSPLKDSEAGKILYGHISNVVTSLGKFVADQQKIHDDIIKALGPPPPK